MRIISKRTLREYWEKHGDSENALKIWYKETEAAQWKNFVELKKIFRTADYVGNDRVVFDIKGNNYRLIAKIDFEFRLVFVRFVGTHAEYDKINKKVKAKNI